MKRLITFYVMALFLIVTVGCSKEDKPVTKSKVDTENANSQKNQIFYFGEGEHWFGTYTISKVKSSNFNSLYIQYITDRNASVDEQTSPKIGKIEYVLTMGDDSMKSSFPLALKGIGNYHTASEVNAEIYDTISDAPDEITLEVKWLNHKETIKLTKQN